ncbi:nuclear transport factor 2 family protein [Variovorax sp. IB41]|uniref:nuclear transport factor 2 family protein n=1 Tax=Variovorax sp. IB41 TaxID=2779370 RepID=UPI0018E70460|nr:nuclear transport factor 2 family protein [Variovorax sp. IB41]MBJ2157319.1 nuclear transport factor 2 family protein [Variovorax sp. IB41]
MTEQEANVAALRKGYDLWNGSQAASAQHWMDMIDDDVRWRSLGDGAAGAEFTRECCSKDEVLRYFEQMGAQWTLISYDANEFIAQGDRVVMLGSCEWAHRQTGKAVKTPKADVVRFRDGKIVEFMEYYDTAAVSAATR